MILEAHLNKQQLQQLADYLSIGLACDNPNYKQWALEEIAKTLTIEFGDMKWKPGVNPVPLKYKNHHD